MVYTTRKDCHKERAGFHGFTAESAVNVETIKAWRCLYCGIYRARIREWRLRNELRNHIGGVWLYGDDPNEIMEFIRVAVVLKA